MKFSVKVEKVVNGYTFMLNPKHISALKKLVDFNEANDKWAKLWDLELDNQQYVNFRILWLLDLAWRISMPHINDWEPLWYPTNLWKKFLKWEEQCYDRVWTIDNEIIPLDHPAWETVKQKPQLKYIHEIIDNPRFQNYNDFREQRSVGASDAAGAEDTEIDW